MQIGIEVLYNTPNGWEKAISAGFDPDDKKSVRLLTEDGTVTKLFDKIVAVGCHYFLKFNNEPKSETRPYSIEGVTDNMEVILKDLITGETRNTNDYAGVLMRIPKAGEYFYASKEWRQNKKTIFKKENKVIVALALDESLNNFTIFSAPTEGIFLYGVKTSEELVAPVSVAA